MRNTNPYLKHGRPHWAGQPWGGSWGQTSTPMSDPVLYAQTSINTLLHKPPLQCPQPPPYFIGSENWFPHQGDFIESAGFTLFGIPFFFVDRGVKGTNLPSNVQAPPPYFIG